MLVLAIVAVSGCQITSYEPVIARGAPTADRSTTDDPDELLRRAATASIEDADGLRLRAAAALIQSGRLTQATGLIGDLGSRPLDASDQFQLQALRIELAIAQLAPEAARSLLPDLLPTNAAEDLRFNELRRELLTMDTDPVAAANRLIAQAPPRTQAERIEHHSRIWNLLGRAPSSQVRGTAANSTGITQAWWQLKADMLGAFTVNDQRSLLTRWRTTNSAHPASQALPAALAALTTTRSQLDHLALLVPQSGRLAAAGKALRDGFIAAHLSGGDTNRQLTILDTTSAPLPALIEQAQARGADLLVGPLSKTAVETLNKTPRSLPALVLNNLADESPPSPNLIQLGLAVEDEASTIYRRLVAEGVDRVVVLHNEQAWSLRARDALMKAAQAFAAPALAAESEVSPQSPSGPPTAVDDRRGTSPANSTPEVSFASERPPELQIVGTGSTPNVKQLTKTVGQALLVAESQSRHARLQQQLGVKLEFEPRARRDVDAIVAFLDSSEARALRPALRFHYSSHLPVYTTSQALRRVSQRDLRDLRGFNISDIPWKLYPSPVRDELAKARDGVTAGALAPLYALGVDAYRLADRMDILLQAPNQRLLGGTGELTLGYDGRVQRDLAWQYVGKEGLVPLSKVDVSPLAGANPLAAQ